ncbi:MAG: serine/threonine protein kinase [Acidobacteriota bacterium]|nr:serine/threonine protein kinase [Acidobacteriota bacterium]
MTCERWRQIWAAFQGAAELSVEQRTLAIGPAAPDDEVRSKLDELLAEHDACQEEAAIVQAPVTPEWPRLGKNLGRFELRGPLGQGGIGEVYRAFDPDLQRDVAIKCVAPNLSSPNAITGMLREARVASQLNHPGIVTVFEVVRTSDSIAIVMELVEGESFRKLAGTPQPLAQIAHWGRQIAEALAAAHERGVIHRDVKPENLILRRDGYTKILDFGLAGDANLPVHSLPMGTVRYMSPEQGRAEALTPATDVFSLGVVLFELATGVHPFALAAGDDTTLLTIQAIAGSDFDPMSAFGLPLPPELEMLLRGMLQKRPEMRPSAARIALRLASLSERKAPEASRHRSSSPATFDVLRQVKAVV